MSQQFVHLHVHSEYSLLEASSRVKGLAAKAAKDQMPALALTDNGNMFAAVEFYLACKDKGVKPILGLEVYMAANGRHSRGQDRNEAFKPNNRLVLLAQNLNGYQNLTKISSIGYQEGFYYKPRIDLEVLEQYNQDVILLSGGLRGEVVQSFLLDGPEAALEKIKALQKIFGDRFYLEINRTGIADWKKINAFLIEASKITGVKLVAANDVHYLEQEDMMAQEVLICIGSNRTLQDETRFKLGTDQFYLKTQKEMRELFKDIPEACDNTLEVAERCDVQFQMKDASGKPIYHLPSFPTTEGRSLEQEIRKLAEEGLERRLQEKPTNIELEVYKKRLNYELGVIEKMGFNGYFLIVQDFINWAKENDIPVGPGRGSGAGSLVAYCLRITDLDPLPHGLLFERFLNPERISMPDFDIDFCQDRRQEVIAYVTNKYGAGSVSQIITYGKLQARAAIRDVGRVLGMTFSEVDEISKLVPDKLNISLKEALELEPRISQLMESNPRMATLMDLAQRIEGLVRHAGIHAAGVIIADGQLVQHAPLYRGAEGEQVVQYDMKHAEKIGLIKFDFLGLKTLTHIYHALKLIQKNRGVKILSKDIPIDDPETLQFISRGDTAGVFQFEGEGITDATRKIKPTSFNDITAITSLYRPGPMANIPDFAKRKNGEAPVEFILPETSQVLKETYGIMVYQEQVMAIASLIAGYSLGEADMLRRAMGKKIKEEMDKHRERFNQGAKEKGFDPQKSEELFDLMYKFADYGFNKSHAAAYSVLTMQTAWIKCNYPAEFFAALLSTEISDTDKIVKYVKDAQKRGLQVSPPHINHSDYLFTVKGDDIYFGLGAIKGVGENAIAAVLEARETLPEKKFTSLEEFFEVTDTRKLNKKVIECLIKAGAFDGFGPHRNQIMQGYQKFLDRALEVRKDQELGQESLFGLMDSEEETKVVLAEAVPWTRTASLAFEKEVLGFYLSDHPLKGFENISSAWTTGTVSDLPRIGKEHASKQVKDTAPKKYDPRNRDAGKKRVVVAGLITDLKEFITKKGTRMAFARVEDLTGSTELIVFPDTFANVEAQLKDERPMLIGGLLEVSEEGVAKIQVDSLSPLEDIVKRAKKMTLRLEQLNTDQFESLFAILSKSPGNTKVEFKMFLSDLKQEIELEAAEIKGVSMSNELLENIHEAFGSTHFIEVN
jgi:DNA polymerase III subunit alpha